MISSADLAGRALIMTTTNGTPAALAAGEAAVLLCASFVNAAATVGYLRAVGIDTVDYIASGGPDADEDHACADYLAELLTDPAADPGPYLARVSASSARAVLDRRVAAGDTGVHPDDVSYCLRANSVPIALVAAPAAESVMLVGQRIAG
ncbi:MAG: 2-phosphosulfolactate phosphatase [Jatrophihabitans sp.]|nr:2-phosphosulfolactate phosphatase [Jatrophihabitans sp.]